MARCSLFSALNNIPKVIAHEDAEERFSDKRAPVVFGLVLLEKTDVSSAKIEQTVSSSFGRSFIKKRNRVGPSTVP